MATFEKGILGGFSGKVGNVVTSYLKEAVVENTGRLPPPPPMQRLSAPTLGDIPIDIYNICQAEHYRIRNTFLMKLTDGVSGNPVVACKRFSTALELKAFIILTTDLHN